MRKILVPTDLGEASKQALRYAISIGNLFDSHILLYNVYGVETQAVEKFKSTIDDIMQRESVQALEHIKQEHEPWLEGETQLEVRVAQGRTVSLISDLAEKGGFDLIVMSSEGPEGIKGLLFGSTAMGVMDKCYCPTLIVPAEAEQPAIDKVVLSIDKGELPNPTLLEPLVELIQQRNAELTVFHKLEKGEDRAELPESCQRALSNLTYDFQTEHQAGEDVVDSIKQFLTQQKADLLCLVRRNRSPLQRLFQGNVTRSTLLESPIPLLVLKE